LERAQRAGRVRFAWRGAQHSTSAHTTHTHKERHPTVRQTDRQDSQTDGQTVRQTYRQTRREREAAPTLSLSRAHRPHLLACEHLWRSVAGGAALAVQRLAVGEHLRESPVRDLGRTRGKARRSGGGRGGRTA
jgi:predicted NAD/FAD-binding protein